MKKNILSTGWKITLAALGINLVLGVLYSWSVLSKALVGELHWTKTEASLPFTVSAAIFAVMMIFAGKAQDKMGPRYICMLGGLILGLGLIASGFATTPVMMALTFGVIGGVGIGLGYSATTPSSIKWFEPSKRGLITGIVVAGIGLSPVYMAPLTNALILAYGIKTTFTLLGVGSIIIVSTLSLFIKNPPADFLPKVDESKPTPSKGNDIPLSGMIKMPQFYLLWFLFMLTAMAGLMLIAHLAMIADKQAAWKAGFVLVIILSVFNAGGRISGGFLSDKIGRTSAMLVVFLVQAANMFAFSYYTSIPLLAAGSALAGLAYGALFSLFPTTTADFFGVKNLGANYGLVFTGWGVAGVFGPIVGGLVVDMTQSYNYSYYIAGTLLIIGALLVKLIKAPTVKA